METELVLSQLYLIIDVTGQEWYTEDLPSRNKVVKAWREGDLDHFFFQTKQMIAWRSFENAETMRRLIDLLKEDQHEA